MTEEQGTSTATAQGAENAMADPDQITLARKRRIRGGYRAHVSKLISESSSLFDHSDPPVFEIERLNVSLKEKLTLLRKSDEEIFMLTREDDIEREVLESEDLQTKIHGWITKLDHKLKTSSQISSSNVSQGSQSQVGNSNPSIDNSAKLPKLQLPKFSGDPKKWQEWWDNFAAVHENANLSPVNKFRHLKSLLEGEAAASISGIQTTGANYSSAIEILQNRFAQKQIIINSHMEVLLNLPHVQSTKDVKALRRLYDNLEINVRSLRSLGIDYKQYGALLTPMITSKIPEEIRLVISKEMRKKDEWDLQKLLDLIKGELEAREQCEKLDLNKKSSPTQISKQNRNFYTTSALLSDNGGRISCSFCNNAHPSVKCTVVSNVNARKDILRRQGRCFVCLKKGHLMRDCRSNIKCHNCKSRHHVSICEQNSPRISESSAQCQSAFNSPTVNASIETQPIQNSASSGPAAQMSRPPTTTMFVEAKGAVLLQTAKAYVSAAHNPQNTNVARLIFDSGSQRTYISERLRASLNLPTISSESFVINTFASDDGTIKQYDVTQLCVRSPYNDLTMFITAYVVPMVCSPLKNQAIKYAANNYPHISNLPLADFPAEQDEDLDVDVLVGSDFYWLFMTGRNVKGERGGPIALESTLGWILSGPVPGCPETSTQANLAQTHVLRVSEILPPETNLEREVSKFWKLESLGISPEENSVFETFNDDIEFKEGRYEVKLPWKPEHPILPDNYQLSENRLKSLQSKLQAKPSLCKEYDTIIKEQESKGIIERVEANQSTEVGKTHYLPHHPVIRQDKQTTKVRVVYDASAKSGSGTSLNNCLYQGPCLLKTVAEILTRFRLYPFAVTSDIEKAFLMVSINQEDRDVLRFLWFDNIFSEDPKLVIYRFCRVVFGVTCSPFLLNATLKQHIERYRELYPDICSKLIHSLYVDDVNAGAYSIEEAMELYEVSKQIMKDGGFNLRKWNSNSPELVSQINSAEINSCEKSNADLHCNPTIALAEDDISFAKSTVGKLENSISEEQKVLGLCWDNKEDSFVFKLSEIADIAKSLPPTKRNVLRVVAKIFDPLGLISPVTSALKVFLQKLFQNKLDWDEKLPDDLELEWCNYLKELDRVKEISVPRFCFDDITEKPEKIELFGFCDSSELAYSAVVYGKVTVNGHSSVRLLASKSRVSPLTKHTIPRLELLSCLILARLIISVQETINPLFETEVVKCWTDSITAYYWIKGASKTWKTFVENRVQEIRKLLDINCWGHCPGRDNPADIPTRYISPVQFANNYVWQKGPTWLKENEMNWPRQPEHNAILESCQEELKSSESPTLVLSATTCASSLQNVIDVRKFSSYRKLLRVTAYILRFIKRIQRKAISDDLEITASEINEVETLWIREAQSSFSKESLRNLEKQFGTFVDDSGVIRCGGRLGRSKLLFDAKHPILMPREHYLTNLLIRESHEAVLHNGVRETLLELRTRFWIVKGRQAVKKVLSKCETCKRIQGKSYCSPNFSQLPEFRVVEEHAFASVGIDFAGPLYLKTASNENEKVYIALFTCAISRAVHLELVCDLTTDAFLRCFRRFCSRRGIPKLVVTDNAKTFKSATKRMISLFSSRDIQQYFTQKCITWKYIVAKAPWMGGFYERLVRSVKSCLKKCLGKARLTYDELHTVLVEVEGVLNSRPLTYMSSDDVKEPLTPSHLIVGRRILNLPQYSEIEKDSDFASNEEDTLKRAKYLSSVIRHCWRRWKSEYLIELREQHRNLNKQNNGINIAEGHIVTVEDENRKNRVCWKLGKVETLIIGQDNVVRAAKVRLGNGQMIERSIKKLYPLETSLKAVNEERKNIEESEEETYNRRPQRKAAIIAKERFDIIDQLENLS